MKEYEREVEKELSPSTRRSRCEDQRRQSDKGMNLPQTGRFPEVLSTAGLDPHSACRFMKLLREKEVNRARDAFPVLSHSGPLTHL